MTSTKAQLKWLSPEDGGRESLPSSTNYSTVARFQDQTASDWRNDAWSLVVDCSMPADVNRIQEVQIRFLAEEGPQQWLQEGKRFELLEGSRIVARGVVL